MIQNFSEIRQRLSSYAVTPDAKYRTNSGAPEQEERIKQKVRQYWADTRISNAEKLEGFELDISGFDPRRTTSRQLKDIGSVLVDMGIIDDGTFRIISKIDVEFDAQGREISLDKQVDVYAYFEKQLESLNKYISKGNDVAKDTLVKTNTAISVLLALEEHAQKKSGKLLVSVRA